MKKYFYFLLLFISCSSFAVEVERDPLDNAIYIECNSCESLSSFKVYALNDFNNRFYDYRNQIFSYTVVNQSTNKAVFLNIQHKYRKDPESGYDLDVVIPTILTTEDEMYDDYLLSSYVVRNNNISSLSGPSMQVLSIFNNDAKVVEINVGSSIHDIGTDGLSSISGAISSALGSHQNLGQSWAKLAGRSVIIVNFPDGKLGAFFASIYSTKPYIYLDGTAVDLNGNAINILLDGAVSVGGSGGVTTSGSGSWIPVGGSTGSGGGGGILACTAVHGNPPVCKLI